MRGCTVDTQPFNELWAMPPAMPIIEAQGRMTKKGIHHFFRYWSPVILYCLLIFIQSSFPSPRQLPTVHHMDKLLHMSCYALLGVLFFRAFRNSRCRDRERLIQVASVLLTAIYGATDELHQYFVSQRSAQGWDLFFDFLGGLAGVNAYAFLAKKYPSIGRL
jgi:VanZ family protein